MKYVLLFTFLVCSVTTYANEDFYGIYEHESPFDLKSLSPERAKKIEARFEETKITLKLALDRLFVKFGKDEPYSLAYQIQGDFLLAEDDGNYWVIYLKEPNQIVSSIMKFNRIGDLNKSLQPTTDALAQ